MVAPQDAPRSVELTDVYQAIDRLTLSSTTKARMGPPGILEFKHIVVAVDERPASQWALQWAAELAHLFQSKISIVTVDTFADYAANLAGIYSPETPIDKLRRTQADAKRKALKAAVAFFELRGLEAEPVARIGSPASEIARFTEETGADIVIVAARGVKDDAAKRLGGTVQAVKNHTRASILIARGRPSLKRLVAGTDGSHASKAAVATAVSLAGRGKGQVNIVHAHELVGVLNAKRVQRKTDEFMAQVLDAVDAHPDVRYTVRVTEGAKALSDAARVDKAGLLVVGCRGRGGLASQVLGSTSDRVTAIAGCSVLVVKNAG